MRSVRRSGRTAERRPTSSSRSAPLLLCPRRACSLELTRRRRASAEPRARRSLSAPPTLSSAHRSRRRAQRAPFWPHRRAPTDVILTFSSVAALPSPRLFTRTDTTTVSERRAASTSFLVSAADLVERAPIVSSCSACAVLAAPPSADRRHPHVQLRCRSALAAPVHSNRHDDGERAPSREHVVPCQRRRPCRARTDRVVVRSVRRPGRTAERRPTSSSRSAPLLLRPRRACSLELTRRRRASAELRARRSVCGPPTSSSAHRSRRVGRGVRHSGPSSPCLFAQSHLTG